MIIIYIVLAYVVFTALSVFYLKHLYNKNKSTRYLYDKDALVDNIYTKLNYKIAYYVPILYPLFNIYYVLTVHNIFKINMDTFGDIKINIASLNSMGICNINDVLDYTYSNNCYSETMYLSIRYVDMYNGINDIISVFIYMLADSNSDIDDVDGSGYADKLETLFLLTTSYYKGKGYFDEYHVLVDYINNHIYKEKNKNEDEYSSKDNISTKFRKEPSKDAYVKSMINKGYEYVDDMAVCAYENKFYKLAMDLCNVYYDHTSDINDKIADVYYKLLEVFDNNGILYKSKDYTILLSGVLSYYSNIEEYEKCQKIKTYMDAMKKE